MTTIELFTSKSFLQMTITILCWAIVYIIVRLFSSSAGVGHLLKTAVKKTGKLRKSVLQLRYICTSKDISQNVARAVKVFHKVLRREKRVSKILNMYLFDDRNDLDVADAKKMLDVIPDICRDVLVKVSESDEIDVSPRFDEIEVNIKQAIELIKKADTLDLKKKILKI